jgi:hypothetical protein
LPVPLLETRSRVSIRRQARSSTTKDSARTRARIGCTLAPSQASTCSLLSSQTGAKWARRTDRICHRTQGWSLITTLFTANPCRRTWRKEGRRAWTYPRAVTRTRRATMITLCNCQWLIRRSIHHPLHSIVTSMISKIYPLSDSISQCRRPSHRKLPKSISARLKIWPCLTWWLAKRTSKIHHPWSTNQAEKTRTSSLTLSPSRNSGWAVTSPMKNWCTTSEPSSSPWGKIWISMMMARRRTLWWEDSIRWR